MSYLEVSINSKTACHIYSLNLLSLIDSTSSIYQKGILKDGSISFLLSVQIHKNTKTNRIGIASKGGCHTVVKFPDDLAIARLPSAILK